VHAFRRLAGLAAAAALLASAPARAQVLIGYVFGDLLASKTFNMGFEVGLNFSTLHGLDGAERSNSTVFGLCADWRFSEHFHLVGAVLPIAGRGASNVTPAATGDPAIDDQVRGTTAKRGLTYFEIPVLLKWAPKRETGLRVGIGPSFGIVTGGTDRYDVTTPAGATYVLERDIGGDLPGLDMGVCVDVEWRFKMLAIAVRYTQGLTDMRLPGEPNAVHSQVLTGTGRIWLGKKAAPSPPPPAP
jgi:hypothetical protein